MSALSSNEKKFMTEVKRYEFIAKDMDANLERLNVWQKELVGKLGAMKIANKGLKENSTLAQQINSVHAELHRNVRVWSEQWADRAPAQELAESFGDKAILLVFGKVNAGKSSFCNFVVDRFSSYEKSVQRFFIDDGKIIETQERFKEGVTETTSRIQGVFLDEKLVLLDTPGLHSVTKNNGELTKRFTDSADGVLWLTSSTSPGQVQELDELANELKSGKPLLPVVTKSDVFEEDEIDGEIVKNLRNKSSSNRAFQEDDVSKRAKEKLEKDKNEALLRLPLSVSVYVAREQKQTEKALEDAGFERLYAGLLSIVQPALSYKRRKVAEVMLHHLEERVLGSLNNQVLPLLDNLNKSSQFALEQLKQEEPRTVSSVTQVVVAALPNLLEQHKSSNNVEAVSKELSKLVHDTLSQEVAKVLADYATVLDASLAPFKVGNDVRFEARSIDVDVKKGAAKRALVGVVGGTGGAWAGAELGAKAGAVLGSSFPIVGTVAGGVAGGIIGGLLGGLLGGSAGNKGGEYFEETEIKRVVVGISYERLHDELESMARQNIPKLVSHVMGQCQDFIRLSMEDVAHLGDVIRTHEQALIKLKEELRNESV